MEIFAATKERIVGRVRRRRRRCAPRCVRPSCGRRARADSGRHCYTPARGAQPSCGVRADVIAAGPHARDNVRSYCDGAACSQCGEDNVYAQVLLHYARQRPGARCKGRGRARASVCTYAQAVGSRDVGPHQEGLGSAGRSGRPAAPKAAKWPRFVVTVCGLSRLVLSRFCLLKQGNSQTSRLANFRNRPGQRV